MGKKGRAGMGDSDAILRRMQQTDTAKQHTKKYKQKV